MYMYVCILCIYSQDFSVGVVLQFRWGWHHFCIQYRPICDSYRQFADQAVIEVESRSRIEYLIPTDNILVFDWFDE